MIVAAIGVGSPSMTAPDPMKVEHPVVAALYDAYMWPQELLGFGASENGWVNKQPASSWRSLPGQD